MGSKGALPAGWKEVPFQRAIDFQEGPGIFAKDFRPAGVPLIRLAGLTQGARLLNGCDYLDEQMVAKKWAHFRVEEGDVLLSTSASLGRIATVDAASAGAIPYTGIIRMRPRSEDVRPSFIPYLLASPHFQRQVEAMGVGSVIRHFGPTHLGHMSVVLPSVRTQDVIAHILGTLDDKIALNRRMNETLEAMARALFQSWFVDFEPVHAKAEGRQAFGMDPATVALFPSEFQDSELGPIPKGWRAGTLEELTDAGRRAITSGPFGSKLTRSHYVPSGVPVIRGVNLGNRHAWFHDQDYVYIPEDYAASLEGCQAFPGDVLFTQRGTLGQVGLIPKASKTPYYILSQSQMKMTCASWVPPSYVFLNFRRQQTIDYIHANATAAGVPHINLSFLRRFPILIPDRDILNRFQNVMTPIEERIVVNVEAARTLTELRDALLPRLLSGELSVGKAMKSMEAMT